MNLENRLLLVADSPEVLRAVDLDRLEDDLGELWPDMVRWLLSQNISDRVRTELR